MSEILDFNKKKEEKAAETNSQHVSPNLIMTPLQFIEYNLEQLEGQGFTPTGIAFGQHKYMAFCREAHELAIIASPDEQMKRLTKYKGIKLFAKTTPGIEFLFDAE